MSIEMDAETETLPVIDIETARDLLLRAVATQGRAFVYNKHKVGCYYTPVTPNSAQDGGFANDPRYLTGCLIGVALDLHGITEHHNHKRTVLALRRDGFLGDQVMTEQAARYFHKAQREQDSGSSWGEAFDAAEEFYRNSQIFEAHAADIAFMENNCI